MKIHFIGVGKMGLPMAGHLRAAGHDVTVSDPDAARMAFAHAQGMASSDAAAGIRGADIVGSSLPHDEALLQVARLVAANAPRCAARCRATTRWRKPPSSR